MLYNMVKSQKLWKVNFFKNADENGGAMAEAIKACSNDQIVIHSQTKKNGRLWGCVKPEYFLNLMEKNYGLYEVITKFPHKVYFDIDKKGVAEADYLEKIKAIITQLFPDAQLAISGSIKETKTSYHIILQNYTIHNEDERQHMKHLVKFICENYDDSFDWKVYTKNRNMKIINQSKDDGRVQEIIENPDFKAHCITCFVSNYSLPFAELPENVKDEIMVTKSKSTFDLGQLPKLMLQTPDDFDISIATPVEILQMLPLNSSFSHDYTHLVSRYCFYNAITFETFLAWLNKKHQTLRNDIVSKWQGHWKKLEKFPPVSKERITSILKYYYPNITKDIHYRKFSQTFNLPTECVEKIETINQSCFQKKDKKYLIFNVGMGGGKTAQTISYLKNEYNYLWIAPNKALATNTHKRFENEDIEVCHYEAVKTKDKKEGKMKAENKLIICLNSIHYVTDCQYNILVIDEIETLMDKFLGDFLEQGKNQYKKQIWINFVNLFKNADKVILLDAFITTKTIKFIQSIEKSIKNMVIYERANEPQTRTIRYMDNEKSMLQDIINKLNQGSKLFIFYPYKNASKYHSMEQIYGLINTATGKKGVFYNADVDDIVKKGLKDVNQSWEDKDFVITNNIITCGVNYENLDFDYKYIFIASHNTPRDIIQVSYRARHLNSGIIKLCYMGKMNQNNTWLNDCEKMNCPIYTKLYDEILIEKKAPLKRSFQLFCVKAHYKQTTDDFKINEKVEEELMKLLENQNVGMSYASIPEIDWWGHAHDIEEKCFAQEATMEDKYTLNKYYFKKSFLETADPDMLAQIWDDKFAFFFKRLGTVLTNENNLFNDIATFNKFNKLFPTDVKKAKLSDEIKARIFKEFSFKYITASSSTVKIIKEIYNTFFAKNVISTYYDNTDNQNVIYNVEPDVYEYFEFAKNNLILDSLTSMTFNKLIENQDEQEGGFEV